MISITHIITCSVIEDIFIDSDMLFDDDYYFTDIDFQVCLFYRDYMPPIHFAAARTRHTIIDDCRFFRDFIFKPPKAREFIIFDLL